MNCARAVKHLLRETDWLLLVSCTAAAVYGLLLIYSASASGAGGNPTMQLLCLILGILTACAVSTINYRALTRYWYLLALPTVLLTALTFTPLGYEVPGTDDRNWLVLPLGSQNFLLQPSELLKITFIVTFSQHIVWLGSRIRKPLPLLGLCLHGALPILLVFLQGDDGNAFIIILLFAALLIIGGIPLGYAAGGTISLAAVIPLVWRYMSPDKQARFLCLFQIEAYRNTTGWQQELSVTAIGAGGWLGVGYLQGGDDNLYARQNDFIFTVAGEEFGFIGAILVLLLLGIILVLLYRVAQKATEPTGKLLCSGMLALMASQAVVNIGMALRVMPVLGITLPFFSAGGSSLLTLFLGIGIAMSVYRYRRSLY
ncbi:MAG: FtsW/RodA/SpoVE family cell cycle protein [Clostridia bacterium]|nr:FtsW/RodA/SpoVE family cell cycle protein [Clostridia bacterium]